MIVTVFLMLMLVISSAFADQQHGLAMYGAPKYSAGFTRYDYVNHLAPKGGTLKLAQIGSFNSLNPFIIKGISPKGMGLVYERLMSRSRDEPFTLYGHIAEFIELAEDRSWIIFSLNPKARFSDGSPITAEDIVFSLETFRAFGRPNARTYYKKVTKAEILGDGRIKMQFQPDDQWEMPLIMGLMTVISKKYFTDHDFSKSDLDIPVGSGPYVIEKINPGRRIQYRRNENYWAKDLPQSRGRYNFERIIFDYYRDTGIAVEAFKAHEYSLWFENDALRWKTGYDDDAPYQKSTQTYNTPAPMIGMVFNTRRALFADEKIRRALTHAFDFEWVNKNLLQGSYKRTHSYFDNSELGAKGLPGADEVALLAPFRQELPPALFTQPYDLPTNKSPGDIRGNLRRATSLLAGAGWQVKSGKLVRGIMAEPFRFEILLQNPKYKKILGSFIKHLKQLGIEASIRIVDTASYQNRLSTYDFDMIINEWGQSLSPGNEQAFYWHSSAADTKGTRNYPGIRLPVIDSLIDIIIGARDRTSLVSAIHALDRVLLWHNFVIPLYHRDREWIVHWPEIAFPPKAPIYGTSLDLWWHQTTE